MAVVRIEIALRVAHLIQPRAGDIPWNAHNPTVIQMREQFRQPSVDIVW
ncbi:hypothetical protein GCM10025857_00790 [Alicyclobacillus contaminans]|nr:hypothetical protein GCM10025857_00790 [Alicyclobacillus contaminans]